MLRMSIFGFLLFSVFSSVILMGKGADAYTQALVFYQEKNYKKAYDVIKTEAERGNKEAQYILAQMYENGEGIKKDILKAVHWYKQAASKYAYVQKEYTKSKVTEKENILERLQKQFTYTSEQKGANFAFSKIDVETPEVKSMVIKFLENSFGLRPYHTNYFTPFTYSSSKYKRYFSAYNENTLPESLLPYREYESKIEAEYQLSFQKPLTYNLFGWNEYITAAYTQQVWWKLYDESAPFRESNYTPEFFMILPTSDDWDEKYNLKALKFGYKHQSNGGEGYASRSWNRLFLATLWQWDSLLMRIEGWYRIPEERKSDAFYDGTDPGASGDDNPDIVDYLGYGEIELKYLYGKHHFNLLLRNNLDLDNNKGAVQFDYMAPFFNSDNTFWYVKLFNGYGESLIDYDNSVTKMSIGFAFSRGLF
ncbi:phospholipase A [Sulfurovum sp.]|uniref:phospholipase A n=1 Tax=Sulfurovum sp. TaxID=1969726 RepID=UPI003566BACE